MQQTKLDSHQHLGMH